MTIDELRLLYQRKQLVEALVESAPDGSAWIVECRDCEGGLKLLTDEVGREQHYNDFETASRSALDIGFDHVRIVNK